MLADNSGQFYEVLPVENIKMSFHLVTEVHASFKMCVFGPAKLGYFKKSSVVPYDEEAPRTEAYHDHSPDGGNMKF